jgi:hypothetical protein
MKQNQKIRTCYAVQWPFGVAMHANTGRPFRIVYAFGTLEHRTAWIERGGDYRTGPNYREAVTRREVEAEIRRAVKAGGGFFMESESDSSMRLF